METDTGQSTIAFSSSHREAIQDIKEMFQNQNPPLNSSLFNFQLIDRKKYCYYAENLKNPNAGKAHQTKKGRKIQLVKDYSLIVLLQD